MRMRMRSENVFFFLAKLEKKN